MFRTPILITYLVPFALTERRKNGYPERLAV